MYGIAGYGAAVRKAKHRCGGSTRWQRQHAAKPQRQRQPVPKPRQYVSQLGENGSQPLHGSSRTAGVPSARAVKSRARNETTNAITRIYTVRTREVSRQRTVHVVRVSTGRGGYTTRDHSNGTSFTVNAGLPCRVQLSSMRVLITTAT